MWGRGPKSAKRSQGRQGGRQGGRRGQGISRYQPDVPPPPVGADGRPFDIEDELAADDEPGRGPREDDGEDEEPSRAPRRPGPKGDRPAQLKEHPQEFRVTEVCDTEDLAGRDAGRKTHPFVWHRLTKRKLTTREAIRRLSRHYDIPRRAFGYGGLKDKQSWSEQVVSVQGRAVRYADPNLKVVPIGRHREPMTSRRVQGNRFRIVVRGLTDQSLAAIEANLADLARDGVPNYFDSQRFGSVRFGQGLLGRELVKGRPEEALRLFLAKPAHFDHSADNPIKTTIRDHWGEWTWLSRRFHASPYGAVLECLAQPKPDFWAAVGAMGVEIRTLHLFAYQSLIWNRSLVRVLRRSVPARLRFGVPYVCGRHEFYRGLSAEARDALRSLEVPLVAPDLVCDEPLVRDAIGEVLGEEGIDLEDLRLPERARGFFKAQRRKAVIFPRGLEMTEPEREARGKRTARVEVRFELPRGAYATIVTKRLFAPLPAGDPV